MEERKILQGPTDDDGMLVDNEPVPGPWHPNLVELPPDLEDENLEFLPEDDDDDEEFFDDDGVVPYLYEEEEFQFQFYQIGTEIRYHPSYNPFYRLVCEPDEYFFHVKSIVVAILKGFLRNCKEVEENVDVIVTLFAKHLKRYPELAEYLDPDMLGRLLYLRPDLYPDSKIAMGALSLMYDTLTHSPKQNQVFMFMSESREWVHRPLKISSPYHVHAANMLAVLIKSNIDIGKLGERLGLWNLVYGLIKKNGLTCYPYTVFSNLLEILLSKSTRHLKYRRDSMIRKLIIASAKYCSTVMTHLNSWKYFAGALTWPGDNQEELEDLVRIYLGGHANQVIAQIALLKSATNSDYARKFLAGNESFMQSLAGAVEQNTNTKKLYDLLKQK